MAIAIISLSRELFCQGIRAKFVGQHVFFAAAFDAVPNLETLGYLHDPITLQATTRTRGSITAVS